MAGAAGQIPFHGWIADACDAAAVRSSGRAFRAAALALVVALPGAVALYLLARVAFLFELAPAAARLARFVGGLTVLHAALLATRERRLERLAARVASAGTGAAVLALGAGKSLGALAAFVVSAVLFAALIAWAARRAPVAETVRRAWDPLDRAFVGCAGSLSATTQESVANVERWVLGTVHAMAAAVRTDGAAGRGRLDAGQRPRPPRRVVPSPAVNALETERTERVVSWAVLVALVRRRPLPRVESR